MRRVGRFEHVSDEFRKNKYLPNLPKRGTVGSAGFDFECTMDVRLEPYDTIVIWSDIKVLLEEGYVLEIYPRSSVGIKQGCMLANTVSIIDQDYYSNPNNDGNIGIAIHNYSNEVVTFKPGDRICQGIIKQFFITDEDNVKDERTGGIGHTGK